MNNKDSFEQRMKMFIEKHKGLMDMVDDKLAEIDKNIKSIKKILELK